MVQVRHISTRFNRSTQTGAGYVQRQKYDSTTSSWSHRAPATHSDERPLGPIFLLEVLRGKHRHEQKRHCRHFPSMGFRWRGRRCRRQGLKECYYKYQQSTRYQVSQTRRCATSVIAQGGRTTRATPFELLLYRFILIAVEEGIVRDHSIIYYPLSYLIIV